MPRITVTRTIDAPIDVVFNAVADIREFSQALPHVMDFEILSETQSGLGTRFRETRLMSGKEYSNELEITEYVEHERARIVTENNGTLWDTVYTVRRTDGGVALTLTMDAVPGRLMAKLMMPFIMGMIRSAVEKDMDLVKEYCEQRT